MKNKKNILISVLIIVLIFIAIRYFGRSVPYYGDLSTVESFDIGLVASYTGNSKDISLNGLESDLNLIPEAYANRTMFVMEYGGYADKLDADNTSNIYLEGNIIQSDNMIFSNGNNLYEIFIVDNAYSLEDIKKFTILNNNLFGEDHMEISNAIDEDRWISDEQSNGSPLLKINNSKYLRLPNISESEIVLLPLSKLENPINKDDLLTVSNKNGEILDGYEYNLLNVDGSDWSGSKINPLVIKTNIINAQIPVKDTGLKIKDTNLIIPY